MKKILQDVTQFSERMAIQVSFDEMSKDLKEHSLKFTEFLTTYYSNKELTFTES